MEEARAGRLVLAGSVGDPMAARLVAAKLRSMGIEAHLRGEGFGPYPVTVGRLAVTEVWVREADLEEARAEVHSHETSPPSPGYPSSPKGFSAGRMLALATAVVLVISVIFYLVQVF